MNAGFVADGPAIGKWVEFETEKFHIPVLIEGHPGFGALIYKWNPETKAWFAYQRVKT